ncbi:MAG: hypothetical protein LC781_20645 [Actinobacteria bacterium]|nr:hypothetical protein [Actinomycetota bacterium]
MKRFKLILAVAATMAAIMAFSAAPAMAAPEDRFFDDGFFFVDCDDFDFDGFCDDDFFFNGDGFQDFEQEAESGDIDQSFDVSGSGDNSNQSVGIQGVANTGSAQNQIGVTQFDSDADDFEFEDVGSDIDVSPESSFQSDQRVNQSATSKR